MLGVVVAVDMPPVPQGEGVAVVEDIGMVICGFGGTAGLLMCLAAKSRSGIAFISSACVSSSKRLMSCALNWVKLARFSSQSLSAACQETQTGDEQDHLWRSRISSCSPVGLQPTPTYPQDADPAARREPGS